MEKEVCLKSSSFHDLREAEMRPIQPPEPKFSESLLIQSNANRSFDFIILDVIRKRKQTIWVTI